MLIAEFLFFSGSGEEGGAGGAGFGTDIIRESVGDAARAPGLRELLRFSSQNN